MIFIAIISFLGILGWSVWDNLKRWKNGNPSTNINHDKQWRLRAVLLCQPVILLVVPLVKSISFPLFWYQKVFLFVGISVLVTLMIAFWFWLLFDGLYSIFRGKHFFSLGSNDVGVHQDARSDDFFQRNPGWLQPVVKIGGISITTIIYILCLV